MARPRQFDADAAVEAAMDAFWAGGYGATSTQDLCEGTGLGRSSLYNAFTSKSHLYQEALRRYAERSRVDQAAWLGREGPVRPIIQAFLLDAVDTQLARADHRGCLAVNAAVEVGPAEPDVASLARADFDGLVETLRALIERGQRDGDISPDRDALALARLTHAALAGIHVVGRITDDRRRLTDIVDALVESL